jgi:energy-coupling factor transporter ATP-binding protein EcfA2
VSGGERKRTSIGVELITDPSLIFLDEPTTGLDSYTAQGVMDLLKELSNQGRTVIQTIHQPNSDCFDMFDKLMLLARGRVIFFNEARLAVNYFTKIDFKCPSLSNPADYFMMIMSIESIEMPDTDDHDALQKSQRDVNSQYADRIAMFSKHYEDSPLKNDHDYLDPTVQPLPDGKTLINTSFMTQFNLILERNFKNIMRIPIASYAKLASTILTALFTIVPFGHVTSDAIGIQNRNGALFFTMLIQTFSAI